MYKLVIAEKPSVAQAIAAVLGADTRCDGYLEGGGYRVSWCVGHLTGLAAPELYDTGYAKWNRDDLPILPQQWQTTVLPGKRARYDALRALLLDADTESVVNACDAGREGELIFRAVYTLSGCDKPMYRLWISSLEESAIRAGFAALQPGNAYDGLYRAALCRAKADWLVGINATRLFSLLYGQKLNVGRVMSPTLGMVVQREAEIAAFVPVPFYTVVLALPGFEAVSDRLPDKAAARQMSEACAGATATVRKVVRREKAENPPALYDLTALQRDANRLLGYTAQQTLDYLQSLYEKKLCTYPRTDSRYLTADLAPGLPGLARQAASALGVDAAAVTVDAARVVNDGKVSDHHAILPTASVTADTCAKLPAGELEVLRLVALRLLCAVGQPHLYAETTATLDCAGAAFTAKGREELAAGWRALQPEREKTAAPLPALTEGQTLPVEKAAVKEGKTTPPKHFTEDTLLAAMETAGAKDMPEDAERKGLGTPATRAETLEKLVAVGFVERRKGKKAVTLLPTPTAAALAAVLPEELQSPLLTAEWEYKLKQIERGELDAAEYMVGIADMVRGMVADYTPVPGAEALFPPPPDVVGRCPRCGGTVAERKKGFFCQNPDCRFALWKDSRFFAAKKKKLDKAMAAALLTKGRARLAGCYSERSGKTYDATVVLADDGQRTDFRLEFDGR